MILGILFIPVPFVGFFMWKYSRNIITQNQGFRMMVVTPLIIIPFFVLMLTAAYQHQMHDADNRAEARRQLQDIHAQMLQNAQTLHSGNR